MHRDRAPFAGAHLSTVERLHVVSSGSSSSFSDENGGHATHAVTERVRVDGKFFRAGESKFYVKGVTYGPFAPNANGESFASIEQTVRDFRQITEGELLASTAM